jgi:hypothetical protein
VRAQDVTDVLTRNDSRRVAEWARHGTFDGGQHGPQDVALERQRGDRRVLLLPGDAVAHPDVQSGPSFAGTASIRLVRYARSAAMIQSYLASMSATRRCMRCPKNIRQSGRDRLAAQTRSSCS